MVPILAAAILLLGRYGGKTDAEVLFLLCDDRETFSEKTGEAASVEIENHREPTISEEGVIVLLSSRECRLVV